MKSTISLSLTVAVALTAMALVGAASASATVLCKENAATCSTESIYPSGTTVEAKLQPNTEAEFKGVLPNYCTSSTLIGKTTAEKGGPLPIEVTGLTVGGCNTCSTAEARNLPFAAGTNRTEAGDGTVTLEGSGKGNPSVAFTGCPLGATCIFGTPSGNLTLKGGNPATLAATKLTLTVEAGSSKYGCGKEVQLSATYDISSPAPLFASAATGVGETVLCEQAGSVCPLQAAIYPKNTSIEAKATSTIFSALIKSTCSASSMSLENTAESEKPSLAAEIKTLTFSGCTGECTTTEAFLPYSASFSVTSGGNGTLTTPLWIKRSGCMWGLHCAYQTSGTGLDVEGGNRISAEQEKLEINKEESSANCSTYLYFSGIYGVYSPSSLWVALAEA